MRIGLLLLALLMSVPSVSAGTLDARLRALVLTGRLELGAQVPVSLRFDTSPSPAQLLAIEAAGARLSPARAEGSIASHATARGRVLGSRRVVPVTAPLSAMQALAAIDGIVRVETSWSPTRLAPLYRTRALSGAEQAWEFGDGQGGPLLGQGVTIADLDSGVDVFHPDFWFADGPTAAWIDVDLSGGWTDGDAVDANANGLPDADESLRWLDAPGSAPGMNTSLQLPIDHFYRDLDGDGVRDFGAGFSESDPTFGEPVYRVLDANGNLILDPGEMLVALGTCKVRAVHQTDGVVRRAGVDLLLSEGDPFGHGTSVQSIHAGGEPGRRFGGLAPGAALLAGNILYGDDFVLTPLEERMAWAVDEGADVIVHEIGGWAWEFLDGSSNVEAMIDDLAAAGVVQVVPAGNLAAGGQHWEGDLGAGVGDSLIAEIVSVSPGDLITRITGDLYWRPLANDAVGIELATLDGDVVALGGSGTVQTVGDFEVFTIEDVSPRGTFRVDFEITLAAGSSRASLDGTWRFTLRRTSSAKRAATLRVHAMSSDDVSGWFGNSTWVGAVNTSTVTWPATADSAITVAAYEPSGGGLNGFSGRGPRVDGAAIVDLAAPGSLTYAAYRNQDRGGVAGGYGAFGGTSAAGPHVAAAVALLRQFEPTAGNGRIRELLAWGAVEDANTGTTPNHAWGHGKLQVFESLIAAVTATGPARDAGLAVRIETAAPNPFNPEVTLSYRLAAPGRVLARVFDLRGRQVRTLEGGRQDRGGHELRWDGRDDAGRSVASGVYLVQIELDGVAAVRKVALVK